MQYNPVDHIGKDSLLKVVTKLWWGKEFSEQELQLIEAMLVASVFHEGAPSSVHTQEVAQLTGSLQQSLIAGIATIGLVHGLATSACARLLQEDSRDCAAIVTSYVESKKPIPGLGHRVYTEDDPRTVLLFKLAEELHLTGAGVSKISELREELARQKIRLAVNIDGAIAALLTDLAIPWQKVDAVFLWARLAGLTAAVYEREKLGYPERLR